MKDRLQKLRKRTNHGSGKSPRKTSATAGVRSVADTVSSSPSFVAPSSVEDTTSTISRIPQKAESMNSYASVFQELATAENKDESLEQYRQQQADETCRKVAQTDEYLSDSLDMSMSIESAAKDVAKDENRVKKFATRAWYGLIMVRMLKPFQNNVCIFT